MVTILQCIMTIPSLYNLLGIWCEKEGIENAKHGDRKMLFSLYVLYHNSNLSPWAHVDCKPRVYALNSAKYRKQKAHAQKHKKEHKNLPFGFYTIKPTPCSAFSKSRRITENPPSQHCLQKGHDLGEVSIWSWKELLLLTTMPYFKLRFSRWACKDCKNLKFKDFTAYVFVLTLLTQASCWLQIRLQLFVWFSFRVLTGPKWLLSLATST